MIEETQALDAFGALSQATRLQMVRALVVAGPEGMAAGAVGEAVGASSSSASFRRSKAMSGTSARYRTRHAIVPSLSSAPEEGDRLRHGRRSTR